MGGPRVTPETEKLIIDIWRNLRKPGFEPTAKQVLAASEAHVKAKDLKYILLPKLRKVQNIIKDANRIVLPSNNNLHEDHQATYEIAVGAAKELNLKEVEFYGYAIYVAHKIPREKKIKINIKNYRDKVFEAISKYKSQLALSLVKMYYDNIKTKRVEFFGKYSLSDIGKYYNF